MKKERPVMKENERWSYSVEIICACKCYQVAGLFDNESESTESRSTQDLSKTIYVEKLMSYTYKMFVFMLYQHC